MCTGSTPSIMISGRRVDRVFDSDNTSSVSTMALNLIDMQDLETVAERAPRLSKAQHCAVWSEMMTELAVRPPPVPNGASLTSEQWMQIMLFKYRVLFELVCRRDNNCNNEAQTFFYVNGDCGTGVEKAGTGARQSDTVSVTGTSENSQVNAELQEQLRVLQEQLSSKETELQQMEAQKQEMQTLVDGKSKVEEKNKELDVQIEKLQTDLRKSINDNMSQVDELQNLKTQMQTLQSEKNDSDKKNEDLVKNIQALKNELKSLKESQVASTNLDPLQPQLDTAKSKIKELESQLESQKSEFQQQREQLETKLKQQEETNNELVKNMETKTTENGQLQTEMQNLKETLQTLETQLNDEKSNTEKIKAELADQKQEFLQQKQEQTTELENQKKLNADLSKAVASKTTENDTLIAQDAILKRELQEMTEKFNKAKLDIDNLKKQVQEQKSELQSLQEQHNKELQEKENKHTEEINKLKENEEEILKQLGNMANEKKDLLEKLTQSQKQTNVDEINTATPAATENTVEVEKPNDNDLQSRLDTEKKTIEDDQILIFRQDTANNSLENAQTVIRGLISKLGNSQIRYSDFVQRENNVLVVTKTNLEKLNIDKTASKNISGSEQYNQLLKKALEDKYIPYSLFIRLLIAKVKSVNVGQTIRLQDLESRNGIWKNYTEESTLDFKTRSFSSIGVWKMDDDSAKSVLNVTSSEMKPERDDSFDKWFGDFGL